VWTLSSACRDTNTSHSDGRLSSLCRCCSVFLKDRLLQPDRHPLRHPRLLHGAHRPPAAEEDGGRQDQTEASGVRGHVRRRRLLHLLPAQHRGQSGAAERPAQKGVGARRGRGGPGLRQPHGPVVHRLPAGPAGVLLLQLGV